MSSFYFVNYVTSRYFLILPLFCSLQGFLSFPGIPPEKSKQQQLVVWCTCTYVLHLLGLSCILSLYVVCKNQAVYRLFNNNASSGLSPLVVELLHDLERRKEWDTAFEVIDAVETHKHYRVVYWWVNSSTAASVACPWPKWMPKCY